MFPSQFFPASYFARTFYPSGISVGPWVHPYAPIGPSMADAAPEPKHYVHSCIGILSEITAHSCGVTFVHGPLVEEPEVELPPYAEPTFHSQAERVRYYEQQMLLGLCAPLGTVLATATSKRVEYTEEGFLARVVHCDELGNVLLTQEIVTRDDNHWIVEVLEVLA